MAKQSNIDKLTFYREYRDSFIHTKEIEVRQSEQRIRFFLALVTGIIAFIGIIIKDNSNYFDPLLVALISLPILFVYGILTFSQTIWSSHVIHNLDITIGLLSDLIKELDPTFKDRIEHADLRDDSRMIVLKDIKGTLAQYMYLTEGLLVAGFFFLLGFKYYPNMICQLSIVAFIAFSITVLVMLIWGTLIKNGIRGNRNK
jgi:hypothetical protein